MSASGNTDTLAAIFVEHQSENVSFQFLCDLDLSHVYSLRAVGCLKIECGLAAANVAIATAYHTFL